MSSLDDPGDYARIHALIQSKPTLKLFYEDSYRKYRDCLNLCPRQGIAVEIGSGAGFVKKILPEITTSDLLAYPGVDRVVDATRMPFADKSVRAFFLLNAFHHIPDAEAFLTEVQRCLVDGGRVFMIDQHPGLISKPILKYAHHEPFDQRAAEWRFETTGPLSGANGALAWIVFKRDQEQFRKKFPKLALEFYRPHSPLRYWLAGGLKPWSLLPPWAFGLATLLDRALTWISPRFGSFVDIELVKRG